MCQGYDAMTRRIEMSTAHANMSIFDDPTFDYLKHEEERRRLIDAIIERDVWLPDDASEDLKEARAAEG